MTFYFQAYTIHLIGFVVDATLLLISISKFICVYMI